MEGSGSNQKDHQKSYDATHALAGSSSGDQHSAFSSDKPKEIADPLKRIQDVLLTYDLKRARERYTKSIPQRDRIMREHFAVEEAIQKVKKTQMKKENLGPHKGSPDDQLRDLRTKRRKLDGDIAQSEADFQQIEQLERALHLPAQGISNTGHDNAS
jgi:hypothetical protein